jgi:hypothetical protein
MWPLLANPSKRGLNCAVVVPISPGDLGISRNGKKTVAARHAVSPPKVIPAKSESSNA